MNSHAADLIGYLSMDSPALYISAYFFHLNEKAPPKPSLVKQFLTSHHQETVILNTKEVAKESAFWAHLSDESGQNPTALCLEYSTGRFSPSLSLHADTLASGKQSLSVKDAKMSIKKKIQDGETIQQVSACHTSTMTKFRYPQDM